MEFVNFSHFCSLGSETEAWIDIHTSKFPWNMARKGKRRGKIARVDPEPKMMGLAGPVGPVAWLQTIFE